MTDAPVLELRGVEKTYPNGVTALRGVDLAVRAGEVHAVVGENGAGKSTLMKIVVGLEPATSGELRIDDRLEPHPSPARAVAAGIGMVHQHFQLAPSMTVAENLALGREPRRWGLLSKRAMRDDALAVGERHGLDLDPDVDVASLGVGDRQRLEIARALRDGARILILDEPTAVLTPDEADRLLATVRRLADTGAGVVLITHKLREVLACADRVTVLRGGRVTLSADRADVAEASLVRAMVGAGIHPPEATPQPVGPVRLRVHDVVTTGRGGRALDHVSLDVHGGQIVGIAGVDGNGQDMLIDVIAGLAPLAAGSVELDGRDVTTWSPARRRRSGLAHVPGDRMARGVMLGASVADSVVADRVGDRRFSRRGVLRRPAMRAAGVDAIDRFEIRADGPAAIVGGLSGGNIQKVVVARELDGASAVVLAAHPTRGVDVRAMARIHEALLDQRSGGAAVILVSSELDELRRLADRIVVFAGGRISGEFERDASLDDIGRAMGDAS